MTANGLEFEQEFKALTGHDPFPWQLELYRRLTRGEIPEACDIPTGLGKTSIIAIWIIALAATIQATQSTPLPRRLIYVVNRRTVVDQATEEASRLRDRLGGRTQLNPDEQEILKALARSLLPGLGLDGRDAPLVVSTLRGQLADNREWSGDPSRPAVVIGTVDMIGSRLLFSGYGLGFRARPLHAGFLGQDALLVHDEAHLEPAFQELLIAITNEQERSGEFRSFRVIELSATSRRDKEGPFGLTEQERNPPAEGELGPPKRPIEVVWRRLIAKKGVKFHTPGREGEGAADRIGRIAREYAESHIGSAVLVFANTLEDHEKVREALSGEQVQVLTGTLRGLERDRMADLRRVDGCPIFARFLKPPGPDAAENERWRVTPRPGTVYLVCTSAGEVGIDISADHMVCDLVSLERMAQRFGRVNRFGDGDANIDIVHEATRDKSKESDPNEQARWKTLELLKELPEVDGRRSASPLALMQLRQRGELRPKFEAAYTAPPVVLPVSDILFDSWALTTIRGKLPGRPAVEPYLHGLSEREPPQTHVAWRDEVELITGDLLERYHPEDLLEDYPLKPHELLRDRSDRVFKHLAGLAKRKRDAPVWLLDDGGNVEVLALGELANEPNGQRKDRIDYSTVLLSPSIGGLSDGLLKGDSETASDVADAWSDDDGKRRRIRVWDDDPEFNKKTEGMRLIRTIDTKPDADEEQEEGEAAGGRFWHWFELPKAADNDGSKTARGAVKWQVHTDDVVYNAKKIAQRLALSEEVRNALILAAKFHDLGKRRARFQRILGNIDIEMLLAKSGKKKQPFGLKEDYRHEFGSLLDVENEPEFGKHSDDVKDLVLHLIAAHHGRGRPHFPPDEAFDPEPNGRNVALVAAAVPRRFARLQRRYGRWGLAYLESLLRAADWAASANPSEMIR